MEILVNKIKLGILNGDKTYYHKDVPIKLPKPQTTGTYIQKLTYADIKAREIAGTLK